MKKILSASAILIALATIATVNAATGSTSTSDSDLFKGFEETQVTNTVKSGSTTTVKPTSTGTTTTVAPTQTTSTPISITTESTLSGGVVEFVVKATSTTEIRRAYIVVNFPTTAVVTSTGAIVKGSLFDMVNSTETKVETGSLVFSASSANGVPANGELFRVKFTVKSGTVTQDYPFSVDFAKSTFTDKQNSTLSVNGDGAKLVNISSASVAPTVTDAKTGFKENVFVLAFIAMLSALYIRTRKNSIV